MSEVVDHNNTHTESKNVSHKRKLSLPKTSEKRIKIARDNKRGFTDSSFEEAEYFIENNLRKVYPYYFTYSTFCKGRWVGKRLVDVFSEEFRAHSREEYEKNIEIGNIKINGKTINSDYVFKENDCVTNKSHRHETPVIGSAIKINHSDDDFVVIEKPPSIPVHPCGRYRHNSLLFILAKDYGLKELYSVHRLDRLTSGLLIFAKTVRKSQEINEQIRDRKVKKEYVCRVEGNFQDGTVTCNEPIEVISPKMGISITSKSGKDCTTEFQKLSFNGKSSVVSCKPKTGRMHQIRVHLQFLGHPIINDPIYNNEEAFGVNKGKNGDFGKSKEELLEDLLKIHSLKSWLIEDSPLESGNGSSMGDKSLTDKKSKVALHALENYLNNEDTKSLAKKYVKCSEKIEIDSACDLCQQKCMDPEPKDLILFLHALKYEGLNWSFETEMPVWARDDWDEC